MAFFPNYLKERYRLEISAKNRTPFPQDCIPSCEEILTIRRKNNELWEPKLFLNEYNLSEDKIDDAIYQICTNAELRKSLEWISKRILSSFGIDNYLTMDVYVRISTSMLNKLEHDGSITKNLNILYHDNLVRNLADLLSYMNEENLPF